MTEKQLEQLTKAMERKAVLKAKVVMTSYSEELKSDVLHVQLTKNLLAYIKREDVDVREIKYSLASYVGMNIRCIIKEITEDGIIICSRKEIKEKQRDALIEKLQNDEEFEATVVHLERYSAFLTIEGTNVILRNIDFAEDGTIVKDKLKVGDKLKVKLKKVTSSKRILVQAVKKYCAPSILTFESFAPKQYVFGVIRTIKPWGCYVCIAPNLDALATNPDYLGKEIEEGMKVRLCINSVDAEKQHIRGRIINIIDDSDNLNLDIDN